MSSDRSLDRNIRGAQGKVAASRYRTMGQALRVTSRTLGVPVEYELVSANISKSGILMEYPTGQNVQGGERGKGNQRIPFNVNTLLELTIDPGQQWLQRPVQCVGKVVRLAHSASGAIQYGVKIVQIEGGENEVWESCFRHLEEYASHLLMTGTPSDAVKALPANQD
jgi:hypothetical protein